MAKRKLKNKRPSDPDLLEAMAAMANQGYEDTPGLLEAMAEMTSQGKVSQADYDTVMKLKNSGALASIVQMDSLGAGPNTIAKQLKLTPYQVGAALRLHNMTSGGLSAQALRAANVATGTGSVATGLGGVSLLSASPMVGQVSMPGTGPMVGQVNTPSTPMAPTPTSAASNTRRTGAARSARRKGLLKALGKGGKKAALMAAAGPIGVGIGALLSVKELYDMTLGAERGQDAARAEKSLADLDALQAGDQLRGMEEFTQGTLNAAKELRSADMAYDSAETRSDFELGKLIRGKEGLLAQMQQDERLTPAEILMMLQGG